MIAVRVGPDVRIAVVGAAVVLPGAAEPKAPQDLIGHKCINRRFSRMAACTRGSLRGGRELKVRVEGQLVFNDTFQVLDAALAGLGFAYVPEGSGASPYRQGSSQAGA